MNVGESLNHNIFYDIQNKAYFRIMRYLPNDKERNRIDAVFLESQPTLQSSVSWALTDYLLGEAYDGW